MFRNKRLIFAVLLTGCTTQAADSPITIPEPIITVVQPNNDLLESVEATLEVADVAIEEIIEEKIAARNTISTLQRTVSHEEDLLKGLGNTVATKDSLLSTYEETTTLL